MQFDVLTKENILLFCYKCYTSPFPTEESFNRDFQHIKYLKKLLNRSEEYLDGNNPRLILNHIITLGNVFTITGAISILIFYCDEKHLPILKSAFLFLKWIDVTELDSIETDQEFLRTLITSI